MAGNNIFSWLFGDKAKERKLQKKIKILNTEYEILDNKLVTGNITNKELMRYNKVKIDLTNAIKEEIAMAKKFLLKDGKLVLNSDGDVSKVELQNSKDNSILPMNERHAPPEFVSNVLPSNMLPSNVLPSNQLPSNMLPSNQLSGNMPIQNDIQKEQIELVERELYRLKQQAAQQAILQAEQQAEQQAAQQQAAQYAMQQQAAQQAAQLSEQYAAEQYRKQQFAQQQAAQQQMIQEEVQRRAYMQQMEEEQYRAQLIAQQHASQMQASQMQQQAAQQAALQQAAYQNQQAVQQTVQGLPGYDEKISVFLLVADLPELVLDIKKSSVDKFIDKVDRAMREQIPFQFGPYTVNGAKIIMYRFESEAQ
jgi:hypothetical protein